MAYLSGMEPHLLAHLLASSATFAAECDNYHACGTAVEDVVKHVHVPSAEVLPHEDGGEGATFPWGIVLDEAGDSTLARTGIGTWENSGTLRLSIDLICPVELYSSPYREQHLWFTKTTGIIVNEMIELSTSMTLGPIVDDVQYGTHLNVVEMARTNGAPFELSPDEELLYSYNSKVPPRVWHDEFVVRYFG